MGNLSISLLGSVHKNSKKDFDCGNEILNNYLKKIAGQDMKRNLSSCFVLENESNKILGYYTLSNDSILKSNLSEEFQLKLPYDKLPITLIGRLAVDISTAGKGYGSFLLIDALKKSYDNRRIIASAAVAVDPIDEKAVNFYLKFGFIALPDSKKMFLTMTTIEKLFEAE